MPECKYCNVELELDDTSVKYKDVFKVKISKIGHCSKCNKKYYWASVYEFVGIEDFEELGELY